MKLKDKYIIEANDGYQKIWWNGAKPFVTDINKAFICPNSESAKNNLRRAQANFDGPWCAKIRKLKIEVL